MSDNIKKIKVLRRLKQDAPLKNIRRALKELYGYSDTEMAVVIGVASPIAAIKVNNRIF